MFFSIFLVFCSFHSHADLCSKLVDQTCEPGVISDRTGVTQFGGIMNQYKAQKQKAIEINEEKLLKKLQNESLIFLKKQSTKTSQCLYQLLELNQTDSNHLCSSEKSFNEMPCLNLLANHLAKENLSIDYSCFPPEKIRKANHKNSRTCNPQSITPFSYFFTNSHFKYTKPKDREEAPGREAYLAEQKKYLMNCTGISDPSEFDRQLLSIQKDGMILKQESVKTINKSLPFNYEKSQKYLATTFNEVRSELIKYIKSMNFNPKTTETIIEHLNSIVAKLENEDCDGASYFHESRPREIRVCAPRLYVNTSKYSLVSTLAHELTHSIDSNSFSKDPDLVGMKNPFEQHQQLCTITSRADASGNRVINNEKFCDMISFKVTSSIIQKDYKNSKLEDKFFAYKNAWRTTSKVCNEETQHDAGKDSERIKNFMSLFSVRQNLNCNPVSQNLYCQFEPYTTSPQQMKSDKSGHKGY